MESTARTNYIFVDYENVQDLDLDLIAGKPVKVFFIVGQRQKSLPTILSKQIHKYHDQVGWIESEGASRNALDLVLAYRVGVQAKADPEGYFHVLSKDKDYDALIKHLRAQDLRACRDEVFSKVSALVELSKMTLAEKVEWVIERMAKNQASRPKTKKTLMANIHAICRKELSAEEVEKILNRLVALKKVEIDAEGSVNYRI
jgi:hypothetical protein